LLVDGDSDVSGIDCVECDIDGEGDTSDDADCAGDVGDVVDRE
jgi:hypothetical protein